MIKQPAIDYVICAAGEGRRFQVNGLKTPKPALLLKGFSFLERSLQSIDFSTHDRLFIVTQKSHGLEKALKNTLQNKYPFLKIHWIGIDRLTGGQLETALVARQYFEAERAVVIYNADTFFRSSTLLQKIADTSIHGIIPSSKQPGEEWSFSAVDKTGNVSEVAEKRRISDLASVGYYYFRNALEFAQYADKELAALSGKKTEAYVAPLYNRMIQDGKRVVVDTVDCFMPMGTPEQLKKFWNVDETEFKRENPVGTLVVDLDGTITKESPSPTNSLTYENCTPNEALISKLQELHKQGFEIIIYTARRMKTFGGDEARLTCDIAETTLNWLKKHRVPFSGIKFGKPFADKGFYIDDKAIRPKEFLELSLEDIHKIVGGDD